MKIYLLALDHAANILKENVPAELNPSTKDAINGVPLAHSNFY